MGFDPTRRHPDGAQSDHLHDNTPNCNAALYGSTLKCVDGSLKLRWTQAWLVDEP